MNCEIDSLDHPDWLTFDLDPSSGKFADAAKTASVLHKILAELRIRSYKAGLRVSGSAGPSGFSAPREGSKIM
jgi:DNA primase